MTPSDYVVETFKASADLSARLAAASGRLDKSKSRLIREALEMYLENLERMEGMVRESVIADFLKQNTTFKE